MARYYFHLKNGTLTPDQNGVELPDMKAVKTEAVRAMRELTELFSVPDIAPHDPWMVWATVNPEPDSERVITLELSVRLG